MLACGRKIPSTYIFGQYATRDSVPRQIRPPCSPRKWKLQFVEMGSDPMKFLDFLGILVLSVVYCHVA